jgi:excisionase family DNA binding protein
VMQAEDPGTRSAIEVDRYTGRLWTPEDVARHLRVPETWVRRAARNGTLPAIKLGKYWRFNPNAINALASSD